MSDTFTGSVKPEQETTPEVVNESQVEQPQYSEEEVKALENGWIPPDQWKGDIKDHRSAREFNDRGELLSKLKQQGNQLREVNEMLKYLSMHNQKVYEAGTRDAIRNLQMQKAEAVKEGDVQKVFKLDEQIDKHKEAFIQQQTQVKQPQGPSPEFNSFVDRNKWYTQDASMRHWANGMAIEFARVNQGCTEGDILDFLEKEVRKEFPQRVGGRTVGAPSPDANGRQSAPTGKSQGGDAFEALMKTFPEEDARVARNLVKHGHVSKEEYVKQFKQVSGGR